MAKRTSFSQVELEKEHVRNAEVCHFVIRFFYFLQEYVL